jgi:hypothetical protein
MYTQINFKTKKALKQAVEANLAGNGPDVTIFAPGLGTPKENGIEYVEGPHYPAAHTWYAQVEMRNGKIVKVK